MPDDFEGIENLARAPKSSARRTVQKWNGATCSEAGCDRVVRIRGLCNGHYLQGTRSGLLPTQPPGRPWTKREDDMIRRIYEKYQAPEAIPLQQFATLLHRSRGAVATRAHKLGLSTSGVSRRLKPERPSVLCPICGSAFTPNGRNIGKTCSPACASKLRWEEHEHPRGMAGKTHTDATKALAASRSRAWWDSLSVEERAAFAAKRKATWHDRPPRARSENVYSRVRSGKRADLDDQFFRSSWEANYARWLNFLIQHGQIASWRFEPKTFEFPEKRGKTFYTPDFEITTPAGEIEWHEVKGWMDSRSKTALKRFKKHYPDEILVLIDQTEYRAIERSGSAFIEHWEVSK